MSGALAKSLGRRPSRGLCLGFQPGLQSGISRLLETPLSINGLTPTPIVFIGAQAAAAGWPQYNNPATVLALQAGTAPSYNQPTPFLGSLDLATLINGGGYWLAGTNNLCDYTTEDLVWEAIVRYPTSGSNLCIADHRGGSGAGWSLLMGQFFLGDGTNTATIVYSATPRAWIHLFGTVDKSGSGIIYANAIAGSAVSCSSVTSISKATAFAIGATSAGTSIFNSCIAMFQMWAGESWLDTHLQPTIAAQRAQLLFGSRPQKYWGPTMAPVVAGTASPSYQRKVESDTTNRLYQISGGIVQRFHRIVDSAGRAFVGILNEGAVQNVCPQSLTYGAWSTRARLSVSATAVECNDSITRTTVMIHEDGTAANNHFLQNAFSITSGVRYVLSLCAKPINRTWIMPQANGKVVSYNMVGAGTIGTIVGAVTPNIQALGNGWYLIWQTFQASSTAGNPTIFLADDDNNNNFDGLNQDTLALSHVQLEVGNYPSMPVDTVASAVTKIADSYILPAAGNIGLPEGGIRLIFWAPNWTPLSRRTLLSINSGGANDRIEIYLHTDGTLNVETAKTGGSAGTLTWAGSKCNNTVHEVLVGWSAGLLTGSCDGVWATADTDVGIITSATQISIGQDHAAANNAAPALIGPILGYFRRPTSWFDRGGFLIQGA